MMMQTSRRLILTASVLAAAVLATGCMVTVEDDLVDFRLPLSDLQVDWTINGSSAGALCAGFGIAQWELRVRGPESRDVLLDCRAHWWSSETDLFALPEGSYQIDVRAVDAYGATLAQLSSGASVYGEGHLEVLSFDFIAQDFH